MPVFGSRVIQEGGKNIPFEEVTFSELEKQLFKLSCLEFDSFEDLEEWVEKNFRYVSGAEWNIEDQVAFLVCNYRILLVFELRDGKWKFNHAEITGDALSWDEEHCKN